jgi:hypothetical protein
MLQNAYAEEMYIPELDKPEEKEESEIEPDIPPEKNPEDENLKNEEELDYEIIEKDNVQDNINNVDEKKNEEEIETYILEEINTRWARNNAPVAFTHQGQSQAINEITLVTNGTDAERSINIDSILSGIAIQPGAIWSVHNPSIATITGSGEHALWHDYFPNRTGWVVTIPGSDLFLRDAPFGAEGSNIIGANDNGIQINGIRRRLGTPWIHINSPAGTGYSHADYISFEGPGGARYSPDFLNDTSRATRTITAQNPGTTTIQVYVPPTQFTGEFYGTIIVNVQTRVTGISTSPNEANLVIHR